MGSRSTTLYIGIGGHVVAIDPATGNELWRTKVKNAQWMTILVRGDRIFAGAGGELFCLDASTGQIEWKNRLKGLGIGLVSFSPSDAATTAYGVATAAGAS